MQLILVVFIIVVHEEEPESKLIFMDDNEKIEDKKSNINEQYHKNTDPNDREKIEDFKFDNFENRKNDEVEIKKIENNFEDKKVISEISKDIKAKENSKNLNNILVHKKGKSQNLFNEFSENQIEEAKKNNVKLKRRLIIISLSLL